MTVIAAPDREAVRDLLDRELVSDVELLLFTRPGSAVDAPDQLAPGTCDDAHELLDELAGLSDRLHLSVRDVTLDPEAATYHNVTAVPTMLLRRASAEPRPGALPDQSRAAGANVRFVGLPAGYEFTTLVADIVDVSKGESDLGPALLAAVRAVEAPVHVQVFVTPACPYCPRAARLAHKMAMENPLIVADVVEANEFPALSERYRVRSVPKTVINDRVEFVGWLPEEQLLAAFAKATSCE